MHGADWPAMRQKYAAFLPDLATRSDLYRVIRWMLSEMAVGHSYLFPAEPLEGRRSVPGGLLGADYEVADGRYRFKKVYGGLNWNPELRSPLVAPAVDVKAGEYLLAVRGIDLRPPTELFSLFENTADKTVEITVGPSPDGKGSRTVAVEPLSSEDALRNRDWVEGNLRRVREATGGRVAYVYVPDTAGNGHDYFKRYFYPQSDKDAIIVDERFNSGGEIPDYCISHLCRPPLAMWALRFGEDIREPGAAIQGPKVMLIDETAGSGGDMLPWMFRKLHVGTLVGKRTWGGLVGFLDMFALMDGTQMTSPNVAIWADGRWVVENEGVPPDVEVQQWPAEVIAGKDPQLEKAIEIILAELAKNPPQTPNARSIRSGRNDGKAGLFRVTIRQVPFTIYVDDSPERRNHVCGHDQGSLRSVRATVGHVREPARQLCVGAGAELDRRRRHHSRDETPALGAIRHLRSQEGLRRLGVRDRPLPGLGLPHPFREVPRHVLSGDRSNGWLRRWRRPTRNRTPGWPISRNV